MPRKKGTTKKASPKKGEVSVVAVSGGGLDAVQNALDSATTEKKSSKKSPKMYMDEPKKGLLAILRKAHATLTEAKAEFESAAASLRDAVVPFYRESLKAGAEFVNTVQVKNDDEAVQVQFKHAYTKVPPEQEGALKEIVGDKYGTLFKKTATIAVKPEVINNDAMLKSLVDKMGPDFAKYFVADQYIVPTEKFTESRFTELTDDQNAQLDGLVHQYKPSVKVR
jgi:hypothetical protein